MWKKIRKMLINVKKFLLNPRLVLCIGIAWLITNGWAYIFIFLGSHLNIQWMSTVAAVYLAILWSPLCVEGILTIAIAIFLLRLLFPDDDRTLKLLHVYSRKYKLILKKKIRRLKNKKGSKKEK